MTDKQLKDKAVKIQGKDYVLVSDRVLYFNEQFENGCIETKLLSDVGSDLVVVQAIVTPDVGVPTRVFTGYSQEKVGDGFINKTSALENAETSAVGRALAMMGIGVIESIASVDEITKANNRASTQQVKLASDKQIIWMRDEARRVSGLEHEEDVDKWITEVLTMPPQKVPSSRVFGAVDRIKAQKAPVLPDPTPDDVEVTDEDLADLKAGKVPY